MTLAKGGAPAEIIAGAFKGYRAARNEARQTARTYLLDFFQREGSDAASDANPIDSVASRYGLSSEEVHLALASLLNDGKVVVEDNYRLGLTDGKALEGRQ